MGTAVWSCEPLPILQCQDSEMATAYEAPQQMISPKLVHLTLTFPHFRRWFINRVDENRKTY